MIDIRIQLEMPEAPATTRQQPPSVPLNERIEKWIKAIESDKDSKKEWSCMKKLYEQLTDKSCKHPKREELLKKIIPTIRKYAQSEKEEIPLSTEFLSEG